MMAIISTSAKASTVRPVSSRVSRTQASRTLSPSSIAPPGKLHPPAIGSDPRRISRTSVPPSPSRRTTAPTPGIGNFGYSRDDPIGLFQRFSVLFTKHRMRWIEASAVELIHTLQASNSKHRNHPVAHRQAQRLTDAPLLKTFQHGSVIPQHFGHPHHRSQRHAHLFIQPARHLVPGKL